MEINDSASTFEIFPWNSNFETGIQTIDEQHQQLVYILNKLATHLADCSNEIVLNEIFEELANYADYHFKTEESIWSEYFFEDEWYQSHESAHSYFIGDVLALKRNEENKPFDDVVYEIVSFLSKWLAYHILDTDKRMAKAVLFIQKGFSINDAKIHAFEEMSGSTNVLINTVLSMYDNLSARTLDLMREKTLRKQAEEALKRSEEYWKFILDGGLDNVWDWNITDNCITGSNAENSTLNIINKNINVDNMHSSVHPEDAARLKSDMEAHLKGETEFFSNKHRVLRKNGSWSWVLSRGKVVQRDSDGNALRMVGTYDDLTERELATQIYLNSNQAILISDINNNIISVNPAFTKITGYEAEEIIGKNPKILSSGKHDNTFFKKMWKSVHEYGQWSGEIYNKKKNGEIFPEILMINTVKNQAGSIDHYFALFDDITEKKQAQELIFETINYDSLTKLPNRSMFKEFLQKEIKQSKRLNISFALLFIDLDHFKDVNDTLGHEIGDALLVKTAHRIKWHLRETDTVAHFGGDKYTIILSDIKDTVDIDLIANAIISILSEPFELHGNRIYVSASIGITLYPSDADDASHLLKKSEQAMYTAKKMGRSRFHYYTPLMQEIADKRRNLIIDLHDALKLKQFEVYYQPIVDLKTMKIKKAEALLRWNHPEYGIVSPNDFIPLAEESGLIIDIGNWVYYEATRQTKQWNDQFDPEFQISINKSPVQFRSSEKIQDWINHLKKIGLNIQNIVIEITESNFMENESNTVEKLFRLHDSGFGLSLDDFGTGYSSLSYLQKFNVDYIKIDRSFVSSLSPHSKNITLCEAIIVMAHKLDIKVVAEGIETSFQHQFLEKLGCDYGQGYLFSCPVTAQNFETLLNVWNR